LVLLLKNEKRKDSGVKLAVSAFLLMNGFWKKLYPQKREVSATEKLLFFGVYANLPLSKPKIRVF
jgi:hypothetical protein